VKFRSLKREPFVILLGIFSVLLYSVVNFIQHARFETFMYDLGVVDQVLFKASRFYAPVSTVFNFPPLLWNRHLDLTLFLLVPLYFIWSDVRMYLILEPAIIALGSFPIYLLAKEKLGRLLAFTVIFSYLFSLGVQFALDFPGHGDIRIATFLAYLLYFLFKGDSGLVYLCTVLSLFSKENSAFYLLFIGLFTILFLKKKKLGIEMIVLASVFWLWFSRIFLPSQRIVYPFWEWYGHLKKDLSDIFLLVYPWIKVKVVLGLLSSFGFFPLFSPALLSVSIPMFAERFLTNRAELWGFALHYNVLTTPVFVFSTILGFEGLKRRLRIRKKVLTILLSCHLVVFTLMTTIWQKTFLTRLLNPSFYHLPEYLGATNEMLSVIPHYASVEAQEDLFPHLSHRDKIYPLGEGEAVEFIALDINLFTASRGGKDKYIKKLLKDQNYGLVFCEEGAVLFERGKKDKVGLCPKVKEFIKT
jgi:uncharacterized membrane protein